MMKLKFTLTAVSMLQDAAVRVMAAILSAGYVAVKAIYGL